MNVVGVLLSVLLACLCACTALPQYGRSPDYSDDAPVVLCPNYPYCDDAPYRIPHLQDEINGLRQRAELIEKVGESIPLQQPNQPFVAVVPAKYVNH